MKSRVLACLVAAAYVWSGTSAAQERWDELGLARIGASADQLEGLASARCEGGGAERACTVAGGVLLGVPVLGVEALLRDGKLARVAVRFDSTHYPSLLAALSARLGEPEDRSYRARAGMAGDFEVGVRLWEQAGRAAILEEYAGKIDRGALTFGDAQSMREALARQRAAARGAWRDL